MNIFVVDIDPKKAAKDLCDKHVVKMIVETTQLLSTAHRVLDGTCVIEKTKNNRNIKRWILRDPFMNSNLCKAAMVNHPCNIWVRESLHNYNWLLSHGREMCKEYSNRYSNTHSMEWLYTDLLVERPNALMNENSRLMTPFPQAMPEKYKVLGDPVTAYRNYYIHEKSRFAKWKYSNVPYWYSEGLNELNNSKRSEVLIDV
jgi:hypothetical protein